MLELQPDCALAGADDKPLVFERNRVSIRAMPRINKVKLQISPHGQWDHAVLEHAVGCELPDNPNALAEVSPCAFWLSPFAWLLVSHRLTAEALHQKIEGVLVNATFALNDLTGRYAIMELKGQGVREVLMSACGVDLDGSSFQPQQYRLTRLAGLAVILSCHGTADTFRLLVDRSEAHYLWDWLEASCQRIHNH